MKHKKHDKIVRDYEKQKSEHLDKLATKMLKNDEKMQTVIVTGKQIGRAHV